MTQVATKTIPRISGMQFLVLLSCQVVICVQPFECLPIELKTGTKVFDIKEVRLKEVVICENPTT